MVYRKENSVWNLYLERLGWNLKSNNYHYMAWNNVFKLFEPQCLHLESEGNHTYFSDFKVHNQIMSVLLIM